ARPVATASHRGLAVCSDASRVAPGCSELTRSGPGDEPVPGPVWHRQAVWHVGSGVVVSSHGGGRRPGEVIVECPAKSLITAESSVGQRLIETRDRPSIHLVVLPIATVHFYNRGFIAVRARVVGWTA